MKKLIFKTMLLSGALLASCSEDVLEAPVQEEYAKSFVDIFGPVHPEQDWNMAEQKSITVDPGNGTEIKVYAREGIAYKLATHYTQVSGKIDVKFDAAKNATDFMVDVNGQVLEAKNGDFVDFSAVTSRTYNPGSNETVKFEVFDEFKEFDIEEVIPFIGQLPERVSLTQKKANGEAQHIHQDFFAKSRATLVDMPEEIVIYPIYWNAGFKHELGIYLKGANGEITEKIPFWRNKAHTGAANNNNPAVQMSLKQAYNGLAKDTWINPTAYWSGGNSDKRLSIKTSSLEDTYINKIRSKGIKLTIPKGVVYGFYMNVFYSAYSDTPDITYYSEGQFNKLPLPDGTPENMGGHAAYFQTRVTDAEGNPYIQTFMGFEDLNLLEVTQGGQSDPDQDFNDLMFILDPAPYIITQDENEWIIASEDLGTTDDYDFNDMVISVKSIAYNASVEETEVTVTGLAAGGTLPLYLIYDNEIVGGSEFHEAFWNKTATNGFYPIINTQTAGPRGKTYTINVDGEFSLATFLGNNMGGFKVQVGETGDAETKVITPPALGSAPQMICVKPTWGWPTERTIIHKAYPGFTSSVKDKSKWGDYYTDGTWIDSNTDDKLILTNSN